MVLDQRRTMLHPVACVEIGGPTFVLDDFGPVDMPANHSIVALPLRVYYDAIRKVGLVADESLDLDLDVVCKARRRESLLDAAAVREIIESGQTLMQPSTQDCKRAEAGDGLIKEVSVNHEETTTIGPLIDQAAAQRVESWIGEAVADGARLLLGGKRIGSLMEATVLGNVRPEMKVSCREVFGPVVTVTPYRELSEAVALLNQSDFGLQAGIFTQDINKIFYAFRHCEVGAVLANEIPTFRADHMPYGGVKDSGLGREGVRAAIEDMTEPRMLIMNLKEPSTPSEKGN